MKPQTVAPPRHFIDLDRFEAALLRRIVDVAHQMKRAGKRVPT
jgi:ornithine carbamoyltransferase